MGAGTPINGKGGRETPPHHHRRWNLHPPLIVSVLFHPAFLGDHHTELFMQLSLIDFYKSVAFKVINNFWVAARP